MRLSFVETHPSHIYEIVSDPSDVTASEIRNAKTNAWKLTRDLNLLLPNSKAVTLLADDPTPDHIGAAQAEPIFVFGHCASATKYRRLMWFCAKQKYFALGARGVLVARKYLKLVKATWPDTKFESYSFSDHGSVDRWFKVLGFDRSWPYDTPANCRVYCFDTAKKDDLRKVS